MPCLMLEIEQPTLDSADMEGGRYVLAVRREVGLDRELTGRCGPGVTSGLSV